MNGSLSSPDISHRLPTHSPATSTSINSVSSPPRSPRRIPSSPLEGLMLFQHGSDSPLPTTSSPRREPGNKLGSSCSGNLFSSLRSPSPGRSSLPTFSLPLNPNRDGRTCRVYLALVIVLVLVLVLIQVFSPFSRGPPRRPPFPRPVELVGQARADAMRHHQLPQLPVPSAPLFHREPVQIPRHVLGVHESPDPEVLARQKELAAEEQRNRRQQVAKGLHEVELINLRRRFQQEESDRVSNFEPPPLSALELKYRELDRKRKRAAEVEQVYSALPADHHLKIQRLQFLEENWRCIHVRTFKGDPQLLSLGPFLDRVSALHPDLRVDIQTFPVALWKLSKLPEVLNSLPTAAIDHVDGPLIWAACTATPDTIESDGLYFPTFQSLHDHLTQRMDDIPSFVH